MHSIVIRKASPVDAQRIDAIDQVSFAPDLCLDEDFYREDISSDLSVYLVAEYNGYLVGYVFACFEPDETKEVTLEEGEKYVAQIASLAVDPSYRGRKIADRLIAAIEQELAEIEADSPLRLVAEAEADNIASLNLFRARGYRQFDVVDDYYGVGRPAIRMQKYADPELSPKPKPLDKSPRTPA